MKKKYSHFFIIKRINFFFFCKFNAIMNEETRDIRFRADSRTNSNLIRNDCIQRQSSWIETFKRLIGSELRMKFTIAYTLNILMIIEKLI